jgi:hypothetical protein
MNRNKMYIAIGGLIALILIGLLIYLMNSQSELGSKQTYTVEIYHCGPLAKDSVALKNEMSVFLLSSAIPASPGFIAPVVDLHEKLEKGDIKKISIPMSGLTGLRETFVSDYYDFNNRKEEENDFIGEHGSFFSSEKYLSFSASALKSGDTAVNGVIPNSGNDTTEFFINTNQTNTNSSDNKVWNSLASLKVYINGLIASNKIKAGSVIKVYYQCGVAPIQTIENDGKSSGIIIKPVENIDKERVGESPQDVSSVFNAQLKCDDRMNNPSWSNIQGAYKLRLEVEVEGNQYNSDGSRAYSLKQELNSKVLNYDLSVKGGLNSTRSFSIVLRAFAENGEEIKLKNNSISSVHLSCSK